MDKIRDHLAWPSRLLLFADQATILDDEEADHMEAEGAFQKQQDPLPWSFQNTGALYKMKTTALLLRQVREKVGKAKVRGKARLSKVRKKAKVVMVLRKVRKLPVLRKQKHLK